MLDSWFFWCLVGFLTGYLLRVGWFLGKLHGVNIRKEESKSGGGTNLERSLFNAGYSKTKSKLMGKLTIVLDALKAAIVMYLAIQAFDSYTAQYFGEIGLTYHTMLAAVGLSLVFGNIASGGKGISTAMGVFVFLMPISLLLAFITHVVVRMIFKKPISYASVVAVSVLFLMRLLEIIFIDSASVLDWPNLFILIIFVLIYFRHWKNRQEWKKSGE